MAYYISKEELLESYNEAVQKDQYTNRLARNIMLIAVHYSQLPRFSSYSPKDELYSAVNEKMLKTWKRVKSTDNLFAYFTTVIHRTFLHVLHQEKIQRERFITLGLDPENQLRVISTQPDQTYFNHLLSPIEPGAKSKKAQAAGVNTESGNTGTDLENPGLLTDEPADE